jgi:hypothetical protein
MQQKAKPASDRAGRNNITTQDSKKAASVPHKKGKIPPPSVLRRHWLALLLKRL